TGGALASIPLLPLALTAAAGYGAYRVIRGTVVERQRATRARQLFQVRGSGNRVLSEATDQRIQELAAAYTGDLSLELEAAGYSAEELKKAIDDLARSSNARIRGMAREVKELAAQYESAADALERFPRRFDTLRDRYANVFSATQMAVVDRDSPLLSLLTPDQIAGGAI